jgi:Spy/CpxP family protein refolding chaperone
MTKTYLAIALTFATALALFVPSTAEAQFLRRTYNWMGSQPMRSQQMMPQLPTVYQAPQQYRSIYTGNGVNALRNAPAPMYFGR